MGHRRVPGGRGPELAGRRDGGQGAERRDLRPRGHPGDSQVLPAGILRVAEHHPSGGNHRQAFRVSLLGDGLQRGAALHGDASKVLWQGRHLPRFCAIVNKLRPALSRAVSMLRHESANATAAAKPKLYITGHSLGGPVAKHTLTQMFLREYDQDFSSIDLYAFGGAMEGNLDFIEMIDEMGASPSVVPTRIYQVENQHDPWPYIPTVFGATGPVRKGNATFLFDLGEDALVRQEPGTPREFEGMPANVLLSMEGIHAPKTAYLPLTRALVPDYDYTTCEAICSVEQCGRFKCGGDYCTGIL